MDIKISLDELADMIADVKRMTPEEIQAKLDSYKGRSIGEKINLTPNELPDDVKNEIKNGRSAPSRPELDHLMDE